MYNKARDGAILKIKGLWELSLVFAFLGMSLCPWTLPPKKH